MIRPWYRSRLFWFGVPGMLFLVWVAWIFPPRIVTRTGPSGVHQLLAYGSTLVIFIDPGAFAPGWDMSAPRRGLEDIIPQGGPWVRWKREIQPAGISGPPHVDYLVMRSWLPALVYGVVWLAMVAGWQRYKCGMMKVASLSDPSSPPEGQCR